MNRQLKARIVEFYGTQADFAEALGVDESLISKVVRGRRALPPEARTFWAKLLRCEPCNIFPEREGAEV